MWRVHPEQQAFSSKRTSAFPSRVLVDEVTLYHMRRGSAQGLFDLLTDGEGTLHSSRVACCPQTCPLVWQEGE